jgi:cytochrome c-type biogenesis protein CcmH
VFVYARAQQGPRMPLAIQRITLGALPATVTLDDSMAMVEGMNLSAFDKLVVMARISPSGSAMAQAGDYMGSVSIELSALKDRALDVLINTPVQ